MVNALDQLKEYLRVQEEKVNTSQLGAVDAKRKVIAIERILQNFSETMSPTEDALRALNRYQSGMGHSWLEENDWVYGLLSKTINYARQNKPKDFADRVYERAHAIQRRIRFRYIHESEYCNLKNSSVETIAFELGREK